MSDDMYKVTNLRITQGTAFGAGGQLKQTVRVSYNVGSDGPFTDVYDAHLFTDAAAQQAIQQRVLQLRNLRTGIGAS